MCEIVPWQNDCISFQPVRPLIRENSLRRQIREIQQRWPTFEAEQLHAMLEIQRQENVPLDLVRSAMAPVALQEVTPHDWSLREERMLRTLRRGFVSSIYHCDIIGRWVVYFRTPRVKKKRHCETLTQALKAHNDLEREHVPSGFRVLYPLDLEIQRGPRRRHSSADCRSRSQTSGSRRRGLKRARSRPEASA